MLGILESGVCRVLVRGCRVWGLGLVGFLIMAVTLVYSRTLFDFVKARSC